MPCSTGPEDYQADLDKGIDRFIAGEKSGRRTWEDVARREDPPTYDRTIFKMHCGQSDPKIYTKGDTVALALECNAPSFATNTREAQ